MLRKRLGYRAGVLPYRPMGKLKGFIVLLVVIALSVIVWYWDSSPPEVAWEAAEILGTNGTITIRVNDDGKGLKTVNVQLRQGESVQEISSFSLESLFYPWQAGENSLEIPVDLSAMEDVVQEGSFEVSVRATDQSNVWLFSRETVASRDFVFDSTPPRIGAISQQHYLRQGGSEAVLYMVSEPKCRSGVQVGENLFEGFPVSESSDSSYIALFALAHDQSPEVDIRLWAEDPAGNRTTSRFWIKTFAQDFRQRRINISDSFIESVSPEILARSDQVSEQDTLLETFLAINRDLRKINNAAIADVSRRSQPRLLWEEPFLQLTNSKVEAVFADHRTYFYEGKECDEQTHLGFDLATVASGSVEASNSGIVVFADYLGIYGNTVIVDHGLGLFSLYGHLSLIAVQPGDSIKRGDAIGQTGQTGLAGGDHLHFSMVLQGVQVNPLEWWDEKWIRERVLSRLGSAS